MHFIAGGLDRACPHPAPHQHDVLVRGVVEAMPAATRRINHVAFDRRLVPMLGVDHPVTLEHDEELVAVMMAVVFVPGAGLEHGPADNMIGTYSFLVDEKLHLHVDPA